MQLILAPQQNRHKTVKFEVYRQNKTKIFKTPRMLFLTVTLIRNNSQSHTQTTTNVKNRLDALGVLQETMMSNDVTL